MVHNNLKVDQIVRIKGDGFIRQILDIRHDEALTKGADGYTGYIALDLLEPVGQVELDSYRKDLNIIFKRKEKFWMV